ncbi:hypothetical protein C9374_006954 [Naegleria lovaniensis]|uniref:MPN domain-containing protein n=1 Tax=Naegleria lovaniensis TaxID=51637 RepID=A0AA88GYL1_NAELO|nr:uncharacterized protein C9374_006954 [Naegleria lovaniensis]KAG2393423.1 hypothetical protein C9374_006954 [Naegleria lovaniensis]
MFHSSSPTPPLKSTTTTIITTSTSPITANTNTTTTSPINTNMTLSPQPNTQSSSFNHFLHSVCITHDCYQSCLSHALTCSEEEIMGLLIGYEVNGVSYIWDCCPLRRLDKRRDRVEISPEQLVHAAQMAEKLSIHTHHSRVVGWYHSHPQFIHLPSTIDLNCQFQYQQMDQGFVGLIISLFSNEKKNQLNDVSMDNNNIGSIKLHAFQARRAGPLSMTPRDLYQQQQQQHNSIHSPFTAMESIMLQAVSVPIEIIDDHILLKSERFTMVSDQHSTTPSLMSYWPRNSLQRIIQIQEAIIDEERDEFHRAIDLSDHAHNTTNLFTNFVYNTSIYQANLVNLIENCLDPLRDSLLNELERNLNEINQLLQAESEPSNPSK